MDIPSTMRTQNLTTGQRQATPTTTVVQNPEQELTTMAPKGSLGTYTPGKPSMTQYRVLVFILLAFSLGMGYFAGVQPVNQWRYFSWHPFLMTSGMVGMSGIAAVTKKLGGYTNTKLHALMSFTATILSLSGIYVIYQSKEMSKKMHLTSNHGMMGAGVMVSCIGLGMAGSIFLHPDFGLQKTNQTIRMAHKWGARVVLILAWMTAFMGLYQMIENEGMKLAAYALPLVALVPFVLM